MVDDLINDDDSTEAIIQRTIGACQRMIKVKNNNNNNRRGEEESGGGIPMSIAMKRHFELEIDTLQNAPRDIDKLKRLLQAKQREYERATNIMDIQRLVTEIEMLKFVLFLVSRGKK